MSSTAGVSVLSSGHGYTSSCTRPATEVTLVTGAELAEAWLCIPAIPATPDINHLSITDSHLDTGNGGVLF